MQGSFLGTEDFSPDDLASISKLSTNEDKQQQLALQLKLAAALRNKQGDHGTMAGQVYIPPNPVHGAMDIFDRIQGMTQAAKGAKEQTGLNAERQAGLDHFMQLWSDSRNKTALHQQLVDQLKFDPNSVAMPTMPDIAGE